MVLLLQKYLFVAGIILQVLLVTSVQAAHYEPNWKSLDSRPLPEWYDDAKIGIFVHWGVFSVPSLGALFWHYWQKGEPFFVDFMKKNYRPGFKYQDFAPLFNAEFYNPDEWADIFEAAGARYVVLTSKHCEGFTLWPSKYSWGWNAMDVGPGRDLVGDLAVSIRRKCPHIHFGLYHSLLEFYNPLYMEDKSNLFATNNFVARKTMPELFEIVNRYKPDVIWSDAGWEATDVYWNATNFLSWLFNDSPVKETVVVNDRWGIGMTCHHGSYYTCKDRYNPGVLQTHKWENCMTLDKDFWGYNRKSKANDYLSINDLLKIMAETVSCGGNLLVNTGPTPDGRIAPIMEERLRQMGEWLKLNGEAIYGSRPWVYQNDSYTPSVWYTQNVKKYPAVYAIVLKWPRDDSLILKSVISTTKTKIKLLGYEKPLQYKNIAKGLEVVFPPLSKVRSKWAFVLKMKNVRPDRLK